VSHFSACFLLVFAQLAVGGFVALAVPPFGVIERGFFKSSAGVFVGCALLYIAGRIALVARAGTVTTGGLVEIGLWIAFAAAATFYFITLWGDRARARARAFATSLLLGLLALAASASVHRLGPSCPRRRSSTRSRSRPAPWPSAAWRRGCSWDTGT
jgi:hypothetical protein